MGEGILGRIARKPREPSAAGFIIVSTLTGLYQAGADSPGLIVLGLTVMMVHLFTFDPILDEARRWNIRWLALLAAVNLAPYVYGLVEGSYAVYKALTVSLAVIGLHLILASRMRWNNPWVYITGSAITTLPAISIPALLVGELNTRILVAWAATAIYIAASSAYIESRLPFRELDPRIPLLVWLPVYILCWWSRILCIAFIEPLFRYTLNILKPSKITGGAQAIKRFGWSEFTRFIMYTILINAALGIAA